MNKIIVYITVLAGILLLGACNLNEYPKFDDADAFVAFQGTRFSVNEFEVDENNDTIIPTLRVPVRLTSLSGLPSTVGFKVIDGTAVAGRDFKLKGGASVLNFDGDVENAVRYIELDVIPHIGEFTGDLVFSLALTSSGEVNMGGNDTVSVTIMDKDHPLSAILGSYTGSGDDAWGGGVYSWSNVVFEKDESDITKIWIVNVFSGYPSPLKVYGVVNEEKTEISVPVTQDVGTISGYTGRFAAATIPYSLLPDGEKLIFSIDGGTVALTHPYQVGIQAINPSTGVSAGWFERVTGLKYVKN
jgi:hypothetical protein